MSTYKLRCAIFAHEKDVRGLAQLYSPDLSFVSVSRDLTSRIWIPSNSGNGFDQQILMKKHKNFVSCVCVITPTPEHPQGMIATGSNDCSILIFEPSSDEPIYSMKEHTNTVCSLCSGNFETLVSGSWDCTVKCWLKGKCFMTLEGHKGAVWSVAMIPSSGLILTTSADKTIKVWKAGKNISTLTGHTDCVRSLIIVDPEHVLTCSNDTTIRLWDLNSETCLHVMTGHTNFIYSLAILSTGSDHFVSCSEDKTVRVWKNGLCVQVITLPVISVWSVCTLTNGDIVTGSSDGVIRVFTEQPEKMASEEELKNFDELVSQSTIPAQIGDINTEDLPGPEALLVPGRREGQNLMVRRAHTVEMYNWTEGVWVKVGEVIGGVGEEKGNKTTFGGKEYDYVFDVDIGEGYPQLKLPYNSCDDPYQVADEFMANNGLSPIYREQIVEFILTKVGSTCSQSNVHGDPLTGGSRYVPGSSQAVANNSNRLVDPFTGASSYMSNGVKPEGYSSSVKYFPETNYIKYEPINSKGLFDKLLQLNNEVIEEKKINTQEIDYLQSFVNSNQKSSDRIIQIFKHLLLWPSDALFPVLDLLRFSFLSDSFCDGFLSTHSSTFNELVQNILVNDASLKNRFLILKALCNCFYHASGRKFVGSIASALLSSLHLLVNVSDKQIQISSASLLLNMSVLFSREDNTLDVTTQMLAFIIEALSLATDEEACFRILVAAGTLLHENASLMQLSKSLEIQSCFSNNPIYKNKSNDKFFNCYQQFSALIRK